jgi:hypothetical protein
VCVATPRYRYVLVGLLSRARPTKQAPRPRSVPRHAGAVRVLPGTRARPAPCVRRLPTLRCAPLTVGHGARRALPAAALLDQQRPAPRRAHWATACAACLALPLPTTTPAVPVRMRTLLRSARRWPSVAHTHALHLWPLGSFAAGLAQRVASASVLERTPPSPGSLAAASGGACVPRCPARGLERARAAPNYERRDALVVHLTMSAYVALQGPGPRMQAPE